MQPFNKEFGKKGEQSAASFLCGKGCRIIGRNVRMGHLETDIIASNGTHILFVEVKTRSEYPDAAHPFGRPACAVDYSKQRKLIACAEKFLAKNPQYAALSPRMDVIEVYILPDTQTYKVLKINHMENAFSHR